MNGILIIDKPKGITSRDVVNEVVKRFNTKKVGHTGTLDPIATGVLVLGVNDGCKIIELLSSNTKTYVAEVLMGVSTDTLDVTGTIHASVGVKIGTSSEIKSIGSGLSVDANGALYATGGATGTVGIGLIG